MAKLTPLPDWTGEDVHLIGGGPSLRGFDFSQLESLNTIGCNQAFELGSAVCHICLFGDWLFWNEYQINRHELERFGGWVATNYDLGAGVKPEWVRHFPRQDEGLSTDHVAWNGNTGAAAINLALILGARRVFLLGYDCGTDDPKGPEGKSHWHDHRIQVPAQAHYDRFATGFFVAAQALPVVFPGREVFNVTDGSSKLRAFPVKSFADAGLKPPERLHA